MARERSTGWLRLSTLFQARPELACFRCFATLNTLVLLHEQAEIIELEGQLLNDIDFDRKDEDAELQEYAIHFAAACRERSDTHSKLLELRDLLKAYNEDMLRFKQMYALPRAEKSTFETLNRWLKRSDGGNNFLKKDERLIWDEKTSFDLVKPLELDPKGDIVSASINEKLIPWLDEKFLGRRKLNLKVYDPLSGELQEEPLRYYSDTAIAVTIDTLITVAAYLLTVAPIFVLSFVQKRTVKIIIVAVFALIFCLAIRLLTAARRPEHFIALAAFTAVLVVFVCNDEYVLSAVTSGP